MKKYNVALVGCGSMGAAHLDDIFRRDHVKIKCVCDLDEERAINFLRKYNAECYQTDYKEVVRMEDVDIVIISTYPSSHLAIL